MGGIERQGWLAAGGGAMGAALVLGTLPFVSGVLSYFLVLVHEMGHAAVGWLYGYPSLPAFDFVYGGGVTTHQDRLPLIAFLVQAALLALAWVFRRNAASLGLTLGLAAAYGLTAWSDGHEVVILAMGHGFELVIAGIFVHRALSGNACHHEAERMLYGFVGFFVTFYDLRFAHGLVTSSFRREVYQVAKGGGHWMDFSQLAERHLHVSLEAVAAGFLVFCLVPPLVALGVNLRREETAALMLRLRRVE